jgi:hypothetical protein
MIARLLEALPLLRAKQSDGRADWFSMEVNEVINVVKTAHEFLVRTTVGTPTEDDTLLPAPKLNTSRTC